MTTDKGVEVLLLGAMYGWICGECTRFLVGHPSKEEAKKSAESHAMSKHAPAFSEGRTSMTLYVQWDDEKGEETNEPYGGRPSSGG